MVRHFAHSGWGGEVPASEGTKVAGVAAVPAGRGGDLATERYLWSYRPLTSPFSFCALCCCRQCTRDIAQSSFGGDLRDPLHHRWGGGCGTFGMGRPVDRGVWAAKTVKRPPQQPAQPPIRQLLGAADAQTAHPATTSTAPAHQRRGSANAETTPAGAPAAAADRPQRPDATCEGKNG